MKRLRDEERGAVLAIVAISLLALLGMVVLTFDLGRGVALKRNMVNAADAAALAAARECGLAHGEVQARIAADQLIADNNATAFRSGFQLDMPPQCSGVPSSGERQVRVTVSVPQDYFFAQIFGFNSGTVTASATAEWTLGATSPAPLRVDQLALKACEEEGVPNAEGRMDCYITYEKGSDPLNSDDRGWLNLPEGWPVQDKQPPDSNPLTCDSQAGGAKDLGDYIGTMGGMGTPGKQFSADLWDPAPTWVCGASGKKTSNVDDIQAWVNNVADMLADPVKFPDFKEPQVQFPVVAPDCPDAGCHEWRFTPGIAYPVVDLQEFYVKGAWNRPKIPKSEEDNCKFKFPSNDSFCVHLQTPGPHDPPSSGGSVQVWLVD